MKKLFLGIIERITRFFATPQTKQPLTLEEALKIGKVLLQHPKVKGGISEHIATRNPKLIPAEFAPKGNSTPKEGVITYFALDIMAWRSLSVTVLNQTSFKFI